MATIPDRGKGFITTVNLLIHPIVSIHIPTGALATEVPILGHSLINILRRTLVIHHQEYRYFVDAVVLGIIWMMHVQIYLIT